MASKQHDIKVVFDAIITPFRQKMSELSSEMKGLNNKFAIGTEVMKHNATQGEKLAFNADHYRNKLTLQNQVLEQQKTLLNDLNRANQDGKLGLSDKIEEQERAVSKAALQYAKLSNQTYEAELAANSYNNTASMLGRGFDNVSNKAFALGNGLRGVGNALIPVSLGIGAVAKTAYDEFTKLDSGIAGVRKTTKFTDDEIVQFTNSVREFSKANPFDVQLVTKVAEIGGQMNIAKENLLDFSNVMLEMDITTALDLEQGTLQMAQFAAMTQMSQKDFRALGSVIVELGNNFAAREPEILMLGHRLAGVGNIIGLTQAEMIGFSAAIAQTGVNVQAGGSNFSKTMLDMQLAISGAGQSYQEYEQKINSLGLTMDEVTEIVKQGGNGLYELEEAMGYSQDTLESYHNFFTKGSNDLALYAQVAKMTADEFAKMFKENPAEAIKAFVEGLGEMKAKGEDVATTLEAIGIRNKLQRDVLLRLAGTTGEVTRALNMANREWKEANALGEEAALRYGTVESKMKVLKNRFSDIAMEAGEKLAPIILDLAEKGLELAEGWNELDKGTQETIIKFALFTAAAGPVLSVTGNLFNVIGGLTGGIGTLIGQKGLGGLIGKLITTKPAMEAVTGAVGSIGGTAGTTAGSLAGVGGAISELGKAGGATIAAGNVAKIGKEASIATGLIGGAGGLIAVLGVAAFGIVAISAALDEASRKQSEILEKQLLMKEETLGDVWKGQEQTSVYSYDKNKDYGKKAVLFSEETKELLRLHEERNDKIRDVINEANASMAVLDLERQEAAITAAKEQNEMFIGLAVEENAKKQELIQDMMNFTDAMNEEDREKNRAILIERQQEEEQHVSELGEKRIEKLREFLNSEGEERRAKYQEYLEIDREYQERSAELLGETETQKHELNARLSALHLQKRKEDAEEIIALANETRDRELEVLSDQYTQMITEANRAYEAGDITQEAYNAMLQGAINFKDNGVNELNKETNALIQTITDTFPNASVTIDSETGKMKIAFDGAKKSASDLFDVFKSDTEIAVNGLKELSRGGQNALKDLKANGFDVTIKALEDGTNQIELTKNGFIVATSAISEDGKQGFNELANGVTTSTGKIRNDAVSAIQNVINKIWELNNTPLRDKSNVISTTYHTIYTSYGQKSKNASMSYLSGLNYVPFDNFPSILHEGERVLTKHENREYDKANNKVIAQMLQTLEKKIQTNPQRTIPQRIENHYSIELKDVQIKDDRSAEQLVRDIQREIERTEVLG